MILQMDDAIHSVAGHTLDIGVGGCSSLRTRLYSPFRFISYLEMAFSSD